MNKSIYINVPVKGVAAGRSPSPEELRLWHQGSAKVFAKHPVKDRPSRILRMQGCKIPERNSISQG